MLISSPRTLSRMSETGNAKGKVAMTKKYVIGSVRAPIKRACREHTDWGTISPKMTMISVGSARASTAPTGVVPKRYVQMGSVSTASMTLTREFPMSKVHRSKLPNIPRDDFIKIVSSKSARKKFWKIWSS